MKFSICCAGWSGVARRGVGCERFAPWEAVCQQTQRWMRAGCFEAIVHDLWEMLRICDGRKAQPSAIILDSRILQSTPQFGARAGYDSAKRRKSFKIHLSVNMLGQLLALHVTLANEQDRAQVEQLARAIQLRRRTTLSTLV
ncbi:transposase (plasmid) [Mycetohabitans rhizoxinica]|uniref:Transposase n=1 Tax=Mycetohabitans rhizoxinica TaxID=412963 RepID=A0ABZ2PTR2_9BURK